MNAHCGYPPISTKLPAILTMGGVLIYTAAVLLALGCMRVVLSMKGKKDLA